MMTTRSYDDGGESRRATAAPSARATALTAVVPTTTPTRRGEIVLDVQELEDEACGPLLVAVEDNATDSDNEIGSADETDSRGRSCRSCCCFCVATGGGDDDDDEPSSASQPLPPSRCRVAKREARALLLDLALPTVLIQVATAVPTFLASSYVGRNFGYLNLAGFTLANLTTNLFSMSLLQGMYTASDTLGPAHYAVRATRSHVGILAVRGYALSLSVALPVAAVLCVVLRAVLRSGWKEDPAVADPAVLWYRVTALSLPFYAAVMVAYKFLAAQQRLMSIVVIMGVSSAVVLPLFLRVVSWLSWGYSGTAWAVVAFQATEALLLLLYLWVKQPHDPETWISWRHNWRRAVSDTSAIRTYLRLGIGGILASTSWVYWETVCLLVGSRMGPLALSAHCVACQVLCLLYMLPQGVGVAIAVRVSSVAAAAATATASASAPKPKVLVWVCLAASTIVFAALSVTLYVARDAVLGCFTTEDVLVQEARRIWAKVCWYNFNTSMFGIHFGIATALGMQRLMGLVAVVVLWAVAFPVMYWVSFSGQGSLGTVWSCLWPPYVAINLIMSFVLLARDWKNTGRQHFDHTPSPVLDDLQTSLLGDYRRALSSEEMTGDDAT